ncbi:hypothetical protein [Methylosinus sp. RM1]|uniref:hypothetical protein n=1 Tax=Methylosinus sp. RM1 TaxID=2583817 RepID=UPI001408C037|nr:hypothetical protein [Methylosinus sp. RM1]
MYGLLRRRLFMRRTGRAERDCGEEGIRRPIAAADEEGPDGRKALQNDEQRHQAGDSRTRRKPPSAHFVTLLALALDHHARSQPGAFSIE